MHIRYCLGFKGGIVSIGGTAPARARSSELLRVCKVTKMQINQHLEATSAVGLQAPKADSCSFPPSMRSSGLCVL